MKKYIYFVVVLSAILVAVTPVMADNKKNSGLHIDRTDILCIESSNNSFRNEYKLKLTNVQSSQPLAFAFCQGQYIIFNATKNDRFDIIGFSKKTKKEISPFSYVGNTSEISINNKSVVLGDIGSGVDFGIKTDQRKEYVVSVIPNDVIRTKALKKTEGDILLYIASIIDGSKDIKISTDGSKSVLPAQKYICYLQNCGINEDKNYYFIPEYVSKSPKLMDEQVLLNLQSGNVAHATNIMHVSQKKNDYDEIILGWDSMYDVARYYVYASKPKGRLELRGVIDANKNLNGIMYFKDYPLETGWYRYVVVAVNPYNKPMYVSKTFYGHTQKANSQNPFQK